MRVGRITAIIGGAALALGLSAGPALADNPGGNVAASVTVGSSLTLTGLSPTVNWGTVAAGASATQTNAEVFDVSTNLVNGYNVEISPNSGGLGAIGDTAITIIQPSGSFAPGTYPFIENGVPITVGTDRGPTADDHYIENWQVDVPATAAPGTYTGNYGVYAFAN